MSARYNPDHASLYAVPLVFYTSTIWTVADDAAATDIMSTSSSIPQARPGVGTYSTSWVIHKHSKDIVYGDTSYNSCVRKFKSPWSDMK